MVENLGQVGRTTLKRKINSYNSLCKVNPKIIFLVIDFRDSEIFKIGFGVFFYKMIPLDTAFYGVEIRITFGMEAISVTFI